MRYLIVGNGRLATHLHLYFEMLGISHSQWHRGQSNFSQLVQQSDTILLAISDSAIANFYDSHKELHNKVVVHFSGSLNLPHIYSSHPLMTFSDKSMSLSEYQEMAFVTVKGQKIFSEIFPELENPSYSIDENDKKLYHALCVSSGNFTNILWRECFKQFVQLNIPKAAVKNYARKCFENILQDPDNSLTGPIARGDQTTIEENRKSLRETKLLPLYDNFLDLHNKSEAAR